MIFSLYKKSTLSRRIERRMGLHKIKKVTDYVRYLRENSQESNLLFKELLIGVTSFFRDPAVWEQMKDKFIPQLLATRAQGGNPQSMDHWMLDGRRGLFPCDCL